jgi:hypothetical protein
VFATTAAAGKIVQTDFLESIFFDENESKMQLERQKTTSLLLLDGMCHYLRE